MAFIVRSSLAASLAVLLALTAAMGIGAIVLPTVASASPMVKNEPNVSRTTFSVQNIAGYQDSGCPLPPRVYPPPRPNEPWTEGYSYQPEHTCPWSVAVKQGGRVMWQRVFSGDGTVVAAVGEEDFNGDDEGAFGSAGYPWSCANTGRMRWETTVWDDLGSGWQEHSVGVFKVPRCIPTHRVGEPRWKAHRAILRQLRGEYVSRLRCKARKGGWRCAVIYNNTFRLCSAVFRVDFYGEVEFGEQRRYPEIKRRKRRCVSF